MKSLALSGVARDMLPRAWALSALSLVFVGQLLTHLVYSLNRAGGDPGLAKILSIVPRDSDRLLAVDLVIVERQRRNVPVGRVRLPESWRSPPRRRLPFLMVFVDARRVSFQRDAPTKALEADRPHAYYHRIARRTAGREYVLEIACPSMFPCRTAVIVMDDAVVKLAVAWDRVWRNPIRVIGVCTALVAWVALGWHVWRTCPPAHLAFGLGLFLCASAAWVTGDRYSTPLAAPILGLEMLSLAVPLVVPWLLKEEG